MMPYRERGKMHWKIRDNWNVASLSCAHATQRGDKAGLHGGATQSSTGVADNPQAGHAGSDAMYVHVYAVGEKR